jgi:hypothetical protein
MSYTPGGHLGLAHRAAAGRLPVGRIQLGRPDDLLDGHVPVEQFVARLPDRAHPAAADDGIEPVPPAQYAPGLVSPPGLVCAPGLVSPPGLVCAPGLVSRRFDGGRLVSERLAGPFWGRLVGGHRVRLPTQSGI